MLDKQNSVPTAEEVLGEQEKTGRKKGSGLMRLWVVVSVLWTVATILRINRVWVPLVGWRAVVEGPWMWISLILPPLMFGAILAAIRMNTTRK